MPITIEWYNHDQTILLETFEDKWTLVDFRNLVDDAAALLGTVDHTVHIILDGTHSAPLPGQMTNGIRYALQRMPANQGLSIFVNPDLFARMLINVAGKISERIAQTAYTAASIEEALAIIARETSLH